jgi:L-lactate utilization protein LutB
VCCLQEVWESCRNACVCLQETNSWHEGSALLEWSLVAYLIAVPCCCCCCCRVVLPKGTPVSHVVIALRGKASRSRRGHFATKFAAAHLGFVTADNC